MRTKELRHGLAGFPYPNPPKVSWPVPTEITGKEKELWLWCPHSIHRPWRESLVRVQRRGNREDWIRPPVKSAHGGAALENAPADVPRGTAREGKDNRVCSRKALDGLQRGAPDSEGHTTAERGRGVSNRKGKPMSASKRRHNFRAARLRRKLRLRRFKLDPNRCYSITYSQCDLSEHGSDPASQTKAGHPSPKAQEKAQPQQSGPLSDVRPTSEGKEI